MDRPIPAFYCVYLLRSARNRGVNYIGSTPNPRRRLKQHNGDVLGGPKKTHGRTNRPWIMTVIVTGFPSKISALQFEWAWQHPDKTRHLKVGEAQRVGRSFTYRLSTLFALLRSKSFVRWPLSVRFFASDAHKVWTKMCQTASESFPSHVPVFMDEEARRAEPVPTKGKRAVDQAAIDQEASRNAAAIKALDVTYKPLKSHLAKSITLFDLGSTQNCSICDQPIDPSNGQVLTCPSTSCHMMAHPTCLSSHFLQSDSSGGEMVPKDGACPQCRSKLSWSDLVRELSLRLRAQGDVRKALQEPRAKKVKGDYGQVGIPPPVGTESDPTNAQTSKESPGPNFLDAEEDDPKLEDPAADDLIAGDTLEAASDEGKPVTQVKPPNRQAAKPPTLHTKLPNVKTKPPSVETKPPTLETKPPDLQRQTGSSRPMFKQPPRFPGKTAPIVIADSDDDIEEIPD